MPIIRGFQAARRPARVLCRALACLLLALGVNQAHAQQPTVLPATEVGAPRIMPERGPEPSPNPPPETPRPLINPEQPGRTAPVGNGLLAPASASQGFFTQVEIQAMPFYRPADVLELIPGLITTDQGGGGKANTYYLRGFALDHGSDFAVFVDDVPWNLRTHAHGQGYVDLNSLIPELVGYVNFNKGPYYAEIGDFGTVGSASIHYVDRLPYGIIKTEAGQYGWFRELVANSDCLGQGRLLYAVEYKHNDGSFARKEGFQEINGLLKYTLGDRDNGLSLEALAYNTSWFGNNQVPLRAVQAGLIPLRGTEDPSDGGVTSRYTLNGQWWHQGPDGSRTWANLFAVYYSLDLFSDFTFFLDEPVTGDQRNQIDRRWRVGGNLNELWPSYLLGDRSINTVGLQVLNDWIPHIGLHHCENRAFTSAISDDDIQEFSAGLYWSDQIKWTEKVRTVIGMRGDYYHFNVDSLDQPQNSGNTGSAVFSPKLSLILGPWQRTNFYINGGYAFRSNDARGLFLTVNPTTGTAIGPDGTPIMPVPPLTRSRGAEIGVRSQAIPDLTASAALWYLRVGSELVFNGDTGDSSPKGASDRYGIELSDTYRVNRYLTLDADFAASHAQFLEDQGTAPNIGRHVPEALETVLSAGPTLRLPSGWFADVRFRYFGPRFLIEDGSQSSRATQLFDLGMGYESRRLTAGMQIFNLFNSNGHEQDFFFASALKTDPGFGTPGFSGVPDIHFKALEAFTARFYVTLKW